ncbi:MAG TPA: hypothetical protein VGE55_11055 [Limnobacter sp.]|uniref:hypothetical protein n=1 Tax=Limnobacter sp. TaxID=2003368 RepID=UPI002ED7B305
MPTNLDRYKTDLDSLAKLGEKMQLDLNGRHLVETGKAKPETKKLLEELKGTFEREYQNWYTQAGALIRQLIPDRIVEFQELYKGDGKRKATTSQTYHIQDWLNGVRSGTQYTGEKYYDDFAIVTMRFSTQMAILQAVRTRFESSLHDIQQLVQADLFDSELDASRELLKSGFLRAAGAVAGVVLEKHLAQVATNHAVSTRKAHPTISDFNDLLKAGAVLDVPAWRNIQRLGDLRNLCDHNKHRDPTKDEIEELISGVEKLTKTLF